MRLPQIQIDSTMAKLAVQIRDMKIEMERINPEVQIRQPQADIKIEKIDGQLQIDQSEAFADANLKHVTRMTEEYAAKGKNHVLKSIATAVQQGDQLMKIESSGKTAIPQLAKTNSESSHVDFTSGQMPKSKVKIHYSPGDVKVEIKQNTPEFKVKTHDLNFKVDPGDVNIYLKQKAEVTFSIPGLNINQLG